MKTTSHLSLLAVIVAALSFGIAAAAAQSADIVRASKNQNRAVAASPRAREVFPWLTRSSAPRSEACCPVNELTMAKHNRAWASSPRVLEQFPELARQVTAEPRLDSNPALPVEKNTAVLSSPRTRELLRATAPSSARGGASGLLERGK